MSSALDTALNASRNLLHAGNGLYAKCPCYPRFMPGAGVPGVVS